MLPSTSIPLWELAAGAITLAIVAGYADRRRARRTDPDRVGFMPWTLITVMAVLAALVLTAFALKTGG